MWLLFQKEDFGSDQPSLSLFILNGEDPLFAQNDQIVV